MKKYLGNTFSPMMLDSRECVKAEVVEIPLDDVPAMADLTSVVGHEVTAAVLSALMEEPVAFNRVNLVLEAGDFLYCIIPAFRASEAREFGYNEVSTAGYRYFLVTVD